MIRIVDLFSGAGGESTGIIRALRNAGERYDLAAINHWDVAIQTHRRNHPQARHFQADIQHLNPHDVVDSRDHLDLLWASPECTHHSVARGGRPRSDQSRASAWLVLKWLSELYVRRVILENVPEFMSWGPLGSDGMPLKSKKGATFHAFVDAMRSLGYQVDWRVLCAADYGDPTTRRRFFLQAVRGRARIQWPEPTHAEEPGLFNRTPWVPARDIIDWSIRGESINKRKRSLAPATLRRIETGIRRYWGEWAEPFLVVLRGQSVTAALDAPLQTVTASGAHFGLVQPFLHQLTHGGRPMSDDLPMPTVTGANRGEIGVVEPFVMPIDHRGSGDGVSQSARQPLGTVTTKGRFGVVEPLILHQCSDGAPRTTEDPLPVVLGRGAHSVVEPFLIRYYGSGTGASPSRIPLGTVTTRDRFGLVEGCTEYGLDITFRMLQPHELAAAQGFPDDYWFAGTKTEQVKQIGNAVPVNTASALAESALVA
jgi:DNA (cytosine-5)-methyltransferase 1